MAGRPDAVRRAQGVRVRQGGAGVRDQRDDGAQDGGVPPLVLRGQGIRKEGGRGMADERLCWLPVTELAAAIRRKRVSPVEVVDAILDRVERINPKLNAFVTLTDEAARREAKAAERALMKRRAVLGPLHGVPFSVKDLVVTKGVRTTFGTPLYRDNVPAGPDERAQYSRPAARVDHLKALRGGVKGLRIAYSDDLGFADAVDPEVRAVSAKAAVAFRELGCHVETVNPRWPSPRDCWEQTFCGGIATRMAPYIDRRAEIEPGLYRIIEATLRNPPTRRSSARAPGPTGAPRSARRA